MSALNEAIIELTKFFRVDRDIAATIKRVGERFTVTSEAIKQ